MKVLVSIIFKNAYGNREVRIGTHRMGICAFVNRNVLPYATAMGCHAES